VPEQALLRAPAGAPFPVGPCQFPDAEKILALSDLEGEFEGVRNLLLANGVIDAGYRWTYGKGHLVVCGDVVDRGPYVPELLWLLYKLEPEAAAGGGYVHFILGNHEIMNLSGDFRYAPWEYLDDAAMSDYIFMMNARSELGRWIRAKHIILQIGGNLFVHGGISRAVLALKMSCKEINDICRPFYSWALDPTAFTDKRLGTLFDGEDGPLWYRDYFSRPAATQAQVSRTLKQYQCERIIAGHTVLGQVSSFYQGRVFGIDVNHHAGRHQGLLIEDGICFRVDDAGRKERL